MNVRQRAARPEWLGALRPYARADRRKAVTQLLNTLLPYVALWAAMIFAIRRGASLWITATLAVVAAAFLIRTFIIFHDCCHGSFFASARANRIWGTLTGALALTPL
jgi:acyl-lipid omega-6 desaturase (Delta-12 desaturase)